MGKNLEEKMRRWLSQMWARFAGRTSFFLYRVADLGKAVGGPSPKRDTRLFQQVRGWPWRPFGEARFCD
ncbi:hypothetical protein RRU01S_03_02070 [Agrobacterium rubi TR3 = NBRC 13261]|uniref:Uncharacterized protein n=1 Tax=Agrobacterium rubi TR3 = NBRC 13261 TaxID=1368415 RepID=A0A081CQU0_9HYPH|nr:hypothetical protein RRU01S_03_02070 [Agrobacterium rubi TR3 = NBRC 13261]